MAHRTVILGIESSCDDTSASVIIDGIKHANVIANQDVHQEYGGVVPELASREHQKNIIPVVDLALKKAGVTKKDLSAIAYTQGPGLMGSLIVGSSFAKSMSAGLGIPLIEINHMHGHILAHFIQEKDEKNDSPQFPFLCLTVSGGHTQIVKITDYFEFEILGETKDDAAGEAFDKVAKILGLPYPGGPLIDQHAKSGNPTAFQFGIAASNDYNFSFSGFKTSFLYTVQKGVDENPHFIEENLNDLCASAQHTIVSTLFKKLEAAAKNTEIREIAIAGGVSANSALRQTLEAHVNSHGWKVFVPKFEYCTDNAAMIAIAGYFKYLRKDFAALSSAPSARLHL